MSIVERALQKLQATGARPPKSDSVPLRSAPVVGRVVEAEPRRSGPPEASPGPAAGRRRELVGNRGKTVRIDYDALRQSGLLPPEHQQREIALQYRNMKRPLIRHAFQQPPSGVESRRASQRLIMVTSALPGEGKTFTSINLALSLAMEQDHSVLLVDGDVAKPHVSHTFGVAEQPGLLDLLNQRETDVEPVVLPTDVPGLSILPVGGRSEAATEMLASARMREIIRQLEALDPQGLVVVDSPPILITSEARVLASLFGQVVLVVRAASTPQQAVTEAIEIIGEGPWIGLVLNQASHEGPASGYGYYYRYGYGYGEDPAGAAKVAGTGAATSGATTT